MVLTFLSTFPKCWLLILFRFYFFLKLSLNMLTKRLLSSFKMMNISYNSDLEAILHSILIIICIWKIIWNVNPCLRCVSWSYVFLVFFFFFGLCCLAHGILVEPLLLHWKQCYNHRTAEEVHDHFLIFFFLTTAWERSFLYPFLYSTPVEIYFPSGKVIVLFNIWAKYFLSMNSLSCHVEIKLDKAVFHIKVVFALHPFALWMAHTGSLMFP